MLSSFFDHFQNRFFQAQRTKRPIKHLVQVLF